MLKKNIPLILLLLIGFAVRVLFLKQVPPGFGNDEINIILNAQSVLKTGQNIPGVVTGIFGTPSGDLSGGIHSEISSYLIIPFIALFGFNFLAVKLPFILASLGICLLIFLIVRKFINYEAAIIAAALAVINPWLIFFGRSAYESILSSFFYFLAIFLVIKLRGGRVFYSLPFFMAGLLSYFSAKTLLVPLVLMSILAVKLAIPKQSLKPVIFLNIVVFAFVVIYGLMLSQNTAGTRFSELESSNIKNLVNTRRTLSLSLPFVNLFENKFTEEFYSRLKNSLGELSATFLFLDGQPENIPSLNIPNHGFSYLIDLPLIILGVIYLARLNIRLLLFFLGLLSITLVPNFLNLAGTTYTIRTVILYPTLVMLSALGIYYLKLKIPKKINLLAFGCLIFIYLLFTGNFLYQYFGRLPIERAQGWFLHQRVAAFYTQLNSPAKVLVVDSNPKHFFYRYLFFSKSYEDNASEVNQLLKDKKYSFGNLEVTDSCPGSFDPSVVYIIDQALDCPGPSGVYISNIRDGGDEYMIINDKVCTPFISRTYPLIKEFKYLDIESLTTKDFCSNFLTTHGT